MRGNCILFALREWWRDPDHIYFIIRPSHATRLLPHVMVTRDIEGIEIIEFTPLRPKKGWRALVDAPFFVGRIRGGCGENEEWRTRLRARLRRVRRFTRKRDA